MHTGIQIRIKIFSWIRIHIEMFAWIRIHIFSMRICNTADKQTNRQTDRQKGRQTDRQPDRGKTARQVDRRRLADQQTGRRTERTSIFPYPFSDCCPTKLKFDDCSIVHKKNLEVICLQRSNGTDGINGSAHLRSL